MPPGSALGVRWWRCFHGGHNAPHGRQSVIRVASIIGTKGVPAINPFQPACAQPDHAKLFARDRNLRLLRAAISRGRPHARAHRALCPERRDHWMNVVTACRPATTARARTPEQAQMPLLYTPYVPSLWEDFILRKPPTSPTRWGS